MEKSFVWVESIFFRSKKIQKIIHPQKENIDWNLEGTKLITKTTRLQQTWVPLGQANRLQSVGGRRSLGHSSFHLLILSSFVVKSRKGTLTPKSRR